MIRAFLPEARTAWVVDLTRGEPGERVAMERIHPDGFFTAFFPDRTNRSPTGFASRIMKGIRGISSIPMRSGRS